jgi:hypothetical protein
MTFAAPTGVLTRPLSASPTYLVGTSRVVPTSAARFPIRLPGSAVALVLTMDQLLALEFSFCLSAFVIGPFEALFPPPHF